MNSVRINLLVEGVTEQTFIRDVLAPEMAKKGIYLFPRQVGNPHHKGGNIKMDRVKPDIRNLLKQGKGDIYLSTMFDYFRTDKDWPGKKELDQKLKKGTTFSANQKAELLEEATRKVIIESFSDYNAEQRFIPYIQMHEFEALLYCDADILAEKTEVNLTNVKEILKGYENPEEINDGDSTAPSKRIISLREERKIVERYQKKKMGKVISEAIGIPKIREQCPHFNDWLIKLEALLDQNS